MKVRADLTHEKFINGVRQMSVERALATGQVSEQEAKRLMHTKLVYGVGRPGVRGTCHYGAWENGETADLVEVAAMGQESWVQLAGTTIHEMAHVLAGHGAGHGRTWKQAGMRLGFVKEPMAAGQVYHLAMLPPSIRERAYGLAKELADGQPKFMSSMAGQTFMGLLGLLGGTPRPCSAGRGTKGGKFGVGSGSRLRLYECKCERPIKVRVASDAFDATCNACGSAFERR
jgi:hypothetical protein